MADYLERLTAAVDRELLHRVPGEAEQAAGTRRHLRGASCDRRGDAGDGCDGGARQQNRYGPTFGVGCHEFRRRAQCDRQEACVDNRGDHARDEQNSEVGRQRPDDMSRREYSHATQECRFHGEATSEGGHRRCADHHARGECRCQETSCPHGNAEVCGNVGHEAGEHELGSTHGEDHQGKKIESERHRDSSEARVRTRERLVTTVSAQRAPGCRAARSTGQQRAKGSAEVRG